MYICKDTTLFPLQTHNNRNLIHAHIMCDQILQLAVYSIQVGNVPLLQYNNSYFKRSYYYIQLFHSLPSKQIPIHVSLLYCT